MNKMPDLSDLLQYRNADVMNRYKKDYPNNVLSAEQALEELLKYFWIYRKRAQEQAQYPSRHSLKFDCVVHYEMKEIDDMWHTFLLFTHDYLVFCTHYFGDFIHHVPNTATKKEPVKEFERKFNRYVSYVYDHLGENTLRCWFASLLGH